MRSARARHCANTLRQRAFSLPSPFPLPSPPAPDFVSHKSQFSLPPIARPHPPPPSDRADLRGEGNAHLRVDQQDVAVNVRHEV